MSSTSKTLSSALTSSKLLLAIFGVSFALTAACDDSIQRGWLVDRTRLLGARVEAASDPASTSITPSEKAKVKWLLASPAPIPGSRQSFAFAICNTPAGTFPTPRCEGPVLASGSGTTNADDDGLVAIDIEAPPALAIGNDANGAPANELQLLTAFCAGDTAIALNAATFEATCTGTSSAALLASLTLHVGVPNNNPAIDPSDVALDGAPLGTGRACTDPDVPVVLTNAGERTLVFHFRDAEREITPQPSNQHETLILSHFVTAGELERQYSAIDPEEAAPKDVEIKFTPPGDGDVPPEGRLVEMFFVLRDGRGGVAFLRRSLCARRP